MRNRRSDYPQDVPIYAPPPQQREPLGRRLGRFAMLLGALFAVATAVIVTQQLSRDSLALLIGLTCGVMAMLPTLVLGFLVWRRQDARRHERQQLPQQQPQPYPTPPVIVVSPQSLPGITSGQPALPEVGQPWAWTHPGNQRSFTIVGGEE